jgi:oligopeptide transport system substrate-binding protein
MKILKIPAYLAMALLIPGCSVLSSDPPMTVSVQEAPETYHPHHAETLGEVFLAKSLYETLVTRSGRTGVLSPALAESWVHDEEFQVFTFTLREDARWSDGSPVTADDVRASWLALLDPALEAPNAWYPSRYIAGALEYATGAGTAGEVEIAVVDQRTLSVALREPLSVFPALLDHHSFAVVPREEGVFGGPYVLDNFEDGVVRLKRNRRYHAGEGYDASRVTVLLDPENREVDWVLGAGLEADADALTPLAFPLPSLDYLLFNTAAEPFRDQRLRRALSLAIDNQTLVRELFPGAGARPSPESGPSPEPGPATPAVPAAKPTDREEARLLLSAAGFSPPETGLTVGLLINDREEHRRMAEAVAEQWREALGIETRILVEQWPTYLRIRDQGAFEVARGGWLGYYPDDAAILEAFVSGSLANDGAYRSTRFDELLQASRQVPPGDERRRLLGEAQRILISEDAAILPLFQRREVDLVNTETWSGWEDPLRGRFSLRYLTRR